MAIEDKKKKIFPKKMNPNSGDPEKDQDPKNKKPKFSIFWVYGVMLEVGS